MKLFVYKANAEDVFKDIIRVPEIYRKDNKGKIIPEGSVCDVSANQKNVTAILRGVPREELMVQISSHEDKIVKIDDKLREKLKVKVWDNVEFTFNKIGILKAYWWAAFCASDPTYKIVTQLTLFSVILGDWR